jgi:hypothetical protein
MKRILLLTLIAATVALLGGCATTDYGTDDPTRHEDEHSQILPAMDFNQGGGGSGGY